MDVGHLTIEGRTRNEILELIVTDNGPDFEVVLRDDTRLTVSRRYRTRLQSVVGVM